MNNESLDQVLEDQSLYWNDDKEIVDAIEIYLKNEGIGVIKAYDGIQAIQALMENEIHLILMDIMIFLIIQENT